MEIEKHLGSVTGWIYFWSEKMGFMLTIEYNFQHILFGIEWAYRFFAIRFLFFRIYIGGL